MEGIEIKNLFDSNMVPDKLNAREKLPHVGLLETPMGRYEMLMKMED
tara:strand:- start:104 stop:244 length:141 start_codon:yes stop_codon:yes gene_type:complete